jgi:glycosyltransferase involved in cell wall biosynthesis
MAASLNDHCKRVAVEISKGGFDVVLSNSCLLSGASPIGRYSPITSVLYLQEPKRFLYEASPIPPFASNPYLAKGIPRIVQRVQIFIDDYLTHAQMRQLIYQEAENASAYHTILVNSHFSRESVLRAYGLNSQVCYLGVDYQHFQYNGASRKDYVVGLGSVRREKGIEFVISALSLVPQPRPRLLWIGNSIDPAYSETIKALAARNQVDIELKIMVNDDELPALLGSAITMLYAPHLEPFGFAPLEAGACGVPVIAVAEGGVRETVIDGLNGITVEPDPSAMAAAIIKLLSDKTLAALLGENARKYVMHRWSLTACIDRLESALNNAIERSFDN